ncbi:MAG TPA: nuclear transport factor 2 family protein, partial [Acidimicrobiales bacterium]|nr:nuclear transport factor 2 family protein [Acidimicrobiales bacterium]
MRLAKRRKVRPDDPVAVVTRFLDAANHHDADGLRACVHAEFESFQPLHPARNFRGSGQLISNWRAIFEAEPGFRLTLLRASTTGNTVWAEVHGAGASAEAAGIFIVGVEDARIRWIRVYSDLVEPLPEEPVEEPPEAGTPVDWDRDPIRLVPPRPAAEAEAAEGEEPEGEPAEGEEPAVAAAGGEPPGLRLVGADADAGANEAVAPEA